MLHCGTINSSEFPKYLCAYAEPGVLLCKLHNNQHFNLCSRSPYEINFKLSKNISALSNTIRNGKIYQILN
ncbi:unnamed protein product [Blepharisma stoltei]|uniref:Uncharacterized protein n=1 Tax=Blepharisma stoltei TaxID=1481888 RepID=A0AAU9J5T3_9CILI|nr:unnamed protein product [Blepharisma stoltei]